MLSVGPDIEHRRYRAVTLPEGVAGPDLEPRVRPVAVTRLEPTVHEHRPPQRWAVAGWPSLVLDRWWTTPLLRRLSAARCAAERSAAGERS